MRVKDSLLRFPKRSRLSRVSLDATEFFSCMSFSFGFARHTNKQTNSKASSTMAASHSQQPLVLEASWAESVASLSIAGIDSRYYLSRLDSVAAAAATASVEEEEEAEPSNNIDDPADNDGDDSSDTRSSPLNASAPENQPLIDILENSKHTEDDRVNAHVEQDEDENGLLQMGDHIFKWCSFHGIPFAYQHHAIVLETFKEEDTDDAPQKLRIADFSNWRPETGKEVPVDSSSGLGESFTTQQHQEQQAADQAEKFGCIRTYETDAQEWKKVKYDVGFWKRHLSWSGTCTEMQSDPPGMVRARVEFLMNHPELIPCYNTIQSNCECVALWCKSGTWGTLQAASWLGTAAVGQVKSAATLAGAVTATQVSVTAPAAGVWGWLGLTTTSQVSLAAAQPFLLPAIAAYGVITVGVPAVSLALAHKKWKEMTSKLNEAFWEAAVAQPDLFVECITHWSSQHEIREQSD